VNPKRAYIHFSVVATLADPPPISQISKLPGLGEGRDAETGSVLSWIFLLTAISRENIYTTLPFVTMFPTPLTAGSLKHNVSSCLTSLCEDEKLAKVRVRSQWFPRLVTWRALSVLSLVTSQYPVTSLKLRNPCNMSCSLSHRTLISCCHVVRTIEPSFVFFLSSSRSRSYINYK
jgi:hypothetical protein